MRSPRLRPPRDRRAKPEGAYTGHTPGEARAHRSVRRHRLSRRRIDARARRIGARRSTAATCSRTHAG
eukprot:7291531-Prymnesium_polylepis.1